MNVSIRVRGNRVLVAGRARTEDTRAAVASSPKPPRATTPVERGEDTAADSAIGQRAQLPRACRAVDDGSSVNGRTRGTPLG